MVCGQRQPGRRTGSAAYARSTLLCYFAARHVHVERLVLERFSFTGAALGVGNFTFELLRSAEDLKPIELYVGKGAMLCDGKQLAVWAMGPNPEPPLPTPQSYADTCRLVSAWYTVEPPTGGVPDALRRPLALPAVTPGSACPTAGGEAFDNGQFGGIALGEGPLQPLIPNAQAAHGVLALRPYPGQGGWYAIKTLWFASPDYEGPVLIRGRQLDGPHTIDFGEAPSLVDPQLAPAATLNGSGGWREWPGGTWLRTPGCYAWQIDGTDFSTVIVFKAVFVPAS